MLSIDGITRWSFIFNAPMFVNYFCEMAKGDSEMMLWVNVCV